MKHKYQLDLSAHINCVNLMEEGKLSAPDGVHNYSLMVAIAERLEALVEVLDERLTQIAQNLAR